MSEFEQKDFETFSAGQAVLLRSCVIASIDVFEDPVQARVHNKNREGECLTANTACTKSLRIIE